MSVYIYKRKKIIHLSVTLTDLNQRSQLFSRGMQIKTHVNSLIEKTNSNFTLQNLFIEKASSNFQNLFIKKTEFKFYKIWNHLLNKRIENKSSYFTLNLTFQHMLSTWNPIQIVLVHMLSTWNPIQIVLVLEVFWGQQHFNKYF